PLTPFDSAHTQIRLMSPPPARIASRELIRTLLSVYEPQQTEAMLPSDVIDRLLRTAPLFRVSGAEFDTFANAGSFQLSGTAAPVLGSSGSSGWSSTGSCGTCASVTEGSVQARATASRRTRERR